jgi:hypothetical protein
MRIYEFQARVRLLPTADGGRAKPIGSRFGGVIHFKGNRWNYGVHVDVDGVIRPGSEGVARFAVWVGAPETSAQPGGEFEIREGPHPNGVGTILEILQKR